MSRPIRIGLLWHSASSGNLGVGALTVANLAIARQVATDMGLDPKFTIMGMREPNPAYVSSEEAGRYPIDSKVLLSPTGFLREVSKQDCLLDIGAGDSFAEIYGPKRFSFLWLTKMMAILRCRPLLLSPQTIGPFAKRRYRALAKIAMDHAQIVVARDEMSFAAVEDIAPKTRHILSVDVAFALPYVDRSRERGGPRTRVGVNVSGLLFNEAESGRNRFGLSIDYAQLMRSFIRDLLTRPEIEVHLITHALHASEAWDDDGRIADRLAVEFPSVLRVADFRDPSEAKSYISSLDFLVAGRMHACIAAFSSGVPVVPVAYSRKFAGLFGMLGYDRLIPVQGVSEAEARSYLFKCLSMREQLSSEIAIGMSKVDDLLNAYRTELRTFFAAAVRPG